MKIAVSSGHESSVALVYADDKSLTPNGQNLLVSPDADHLNLHCLAGATRRVEMKKRLSSILGRLRAKLSRKGQRRGFLRQDRLVLCLPGVSTVSDYNVGVECVHDACWPVARPPNYCIIDDTFAGLIAGAQSTLGICAFAGTGASAYMGTPDGSIRNFTPDKTFKLDGYGAMLGDHGSGFRLGMATLEHICRYLDEPEKLHRLESDARSDGAAGVCEALFDVMQVPRTHLQNWFDNQMANRTPDWRFTIAKLAKIITEAAEAGNVFAMERVEEAAEGMVKTLRTALNHEDYEDMHGAPIYCQGGMFRHSPFYLDRVRALLRIAGKNNQVELATYRHPVGALLVAASPSWIVPDADTKDAILRAIGKTRSGHRGFVLNAPRAAPQS